MSDKDLGEMTENFEAEVENLKNTKMKIFGITMTPTTIMGAFALVSAILGSLYGAFEVYKDYMDMKEQIQEYVAPDLSGIEQQVAVVNEKMDGILAEVSIMKESMNETADRVSDIKNDLRDDILRIEKIVDQVEDDLKDTETDVRAVIQNAEERFENKRDALQNDYDQARDRLTTNTEREMKDLEDRLNTRLQRALDNPLAN
jgi:uncharacterized phage infection (PIP) family protein YhgE